MIPIILTLFFKMRTLLNEITFFGRHASAQRYVIQKEVLVGKTSSVQKIQPGVVAWSSS